MRTIITVGNPDSTETHHIELKGDIRMAQMLAAAVRMRQRIPAAPIKLKGDSHGSTMTPSDVAAAARRARSASVAAAARPRADRAIGRAPWRRPPRTDGRWRRSGSAKANAAGRPAPRPSRFAASPTIWGVTRQGGPAAGRVLHPAWRCDRRDHAGPAGRRIGATTSPRSGPSGFPLPAPCA